MKVLFLDIDGVLNSREDHYSDKLITDKHLVYLKEIVDKSNCKLVLSSSWRIILDIDHERSLNLKNRLGKYGLTIFDKTGNNGRYRGDQIREYLFLHPSIDKFCILDDDSDMEEYIDHLVKTDTRYGLLEEHIPRCLALLN